ncbi:MAG: GntR family transcriptional regulator [Kiloniellales bacterium]
MSTSPLALHIANEIVESVRAGRIAAGSHLTAQRVADQFGVSRSPVREAMRLLARQGYLEQRPNRGFFAVARSDTKAAHVGEGDEKPFDTPNDYQRLAEDWLMNRIPVEVTEQLLRDRYELTKSQLTSILMRAVREGWAERKQGYGWRFLPVAKTPEAFEQIYRFRMLIEPAAMLEPTYRIDQAVLGELRRVQEAMLEADIECLPGERLLEAGSSFHEELIKFSGNPYFSQALVRANRMRRLLEYRSRVDRRRLYVQCAQHLEIVGLLEKGEIVEASYLLRRHLGGALATKSPIVWPGSAEGGALAAATT